MSLFGVVVGAVPFPPSKGMCHAVSVNQKFRLLEEQQTKFQIDFNSVARHVFAIQAFRKEALLVKGKGTLRNARYICFVATSQL